MLTRIPVDLLLPGLCLPGDLRDESGQCLFEAGITLTEEHVADIKLLGTPHLYGGSDWPIDVAAAVVNGLGGSEWHDGEELSSGLSAAGEEMLQSAFDGSTVSIRDFRKEVSRTILDGLRFPHDIYDEDGVLLLAAGVQITPRFLQLLRERGITNLRIGVAKPGAPLSPPARPKEAVRPIDMHSPVSRMLDLQLAGELEKQPELRPVAGWRRPRMSLESLKAEAALGVSRHSATRATVEEVCAHLQRAQKSGERLSNAAIQAAVGRFADMAAQDFDLLPLIISMQKAEDEYLYDHCVNVTLLSMSIANQLGLGHEQIIEIGLGAMLQDIGMLRVPESIRRAPRALTPSERMEIERHPLHTLELLEGLRGVPRLAKMIAYQVHERVDGSGYPRKRSGTEIHQYAKIVAAADAYAAMTRPRPYRPAMLPYEAAKIVLTEGSLNKFDRETVRAFLDTISLFPIGSGVELSNGSRAQVIRANPGVHTRPVIEALDVNGGPTGRIIDLSKVPELKVINITTQESKAPAMASLC
ncbi:MAG: HD domain-containing protein [Phycisphaerales bacterium]|nr:MAG: HD domain-containing protein [Phycisphaerales bacterium]